jgi:hypothetical protein
MRIPGRLIAFVLSLAVIAAPLAAQDAAPVPCKDSTCSLKIDWGSSKTSGDYPPDKRYGSGDDFEQRFRNALREKGLRFQDAAADGAMGMVVRPTMQKNVLCDAMAGINPDKTCTAMTNLAVAFTAPAVGAKAPGAIRITNRCGAGDVFLSHRDFATYAAEMIWFQLVGQAQKAERPRVNC